MQRAVLIVGVVLAAAVVTIGGRWYGYVALGESPYDEVGLTLNGIMPSPVRAWGCDRIRSRFPGQLPPYGCPVVRP